MKAAILCPGPSLSRLLAAPDADLIVGVNRAASRFRCHYWAALDWPLIERERGNVIGTPGLLTVSATLEHLQWPAEVVTAESLYPRWPYEWQWSLFSATSAAIFAADTGAKRIDVYGCDMAGTLDWDGIEAGETRGDDRWNLERGLWHRMKVVLGERGIELNYGTV